jgi:hypothetical protein
MNVITTEEAHKLWRALFDANWHKAATALRSLAAEREQLQAENARLRRLVAYLAGTNTDHVQVALAGNPTACDAIHAEALAALGEER